MFKVKTIDFEKIRNMVDASERLDEAEMQEDAKKILRDLADFINSGGDNK